MMKEIDRMLLALALALSCCISMTACMDGDDHQGGHDGQRSDEGLVKYEDGTYSITLPITKQELNVREQYVGQILCVEDAAILRAEELILQQTAQYTDDPPIYLDFDSEGYLCLWVELIRDIEPPRVIVDGEYTITNGCDIDHEHLFFKQRLSMVNEVK